jgi:hypothetical protein
MSIARTTIQLTPMASEMLQEKSEPTRLPAGTMGDTNTEVNKGQEKFVAAGQ